MKRIINILSLTLISLFILSANVFANATGTMTGGTLNFSADGILTINGGTLEITSGGPLKTSDITTWPAAASNITITGTGAIKQINLTNGATISFTGTYTSSDTNGLKTNKYTSNSGLVIDSNCNITASGTGTSTITAATTTASTAPIMMEAPLTGDISSTISGNLQIICCNTGVEHDADTSDYSFLGIGVQGYGGGTPRDASLILGQGVTVTGAPAVMAYGDGMNTGNGSVAQQGIASIEVQQGATLQAPASTVIDGETCDMAIIRNYGNDKGVGNITISGGTINGNNGGSSQPGIYAPGKNGSVTITGGNITGYTGAIVRGGAFNMSSGTLTGTGADSGGNVTAKQSDLGDGGGLDILGSTGNYGDVVVNITGGKVESRQSSALSVPATGGSSPFKYGVDDPVSVTDTELVSPEGKEPVSAPSSSGWSAGMEGSIGTGTTCEPPLNPTNGKNLLDPDIGYSVTNPETGAISYFGKDQLEAAQEKAKEISEETGVGIGVNDFDPTSGTPTGAITPPTSSNAQIIRFGLSSNELLTYYNSTTTGNPNQQQWQLGDFICSIQANQNNSNFTPQNLTWSINNIAGDSGSPIAFSGNWENENNTVITVTNTTNSTRTVTTGTRTITSADNSWKISYDYTLTVTDYKDATPDTNVIVFDPNSLVLSYNGQGVNQLDDINADGTGLFQLNATADDEIMMNSSSPVTQSLRFIVNNSTTAAVNITTLSGTTLPVINTVNLENGRTVQYGYTRTLTVNNPATTTPPTVLGGGTPQWSLSRTLSDSSYLTSDYVVVNSQTGVLTFLQALPANTYAMLNLVVDGVPASNEPILIGTTGQLTYDEFNGIAPQVNPAYATYNTGYDLIDNIVSVPVFQQPINLSGNNSITFTSSDPSQVYVTGSGENWTAYSTLNTTTSATITAVYTYNGKEYTTDFVLNFVTNKINPQGVTAETELEFNLSDIHAQNVKAALVPASTTQAYSITDFTYTSSNSSVAAVDLYGNVTPVGVGTCTVTSTVNTTAITGYSWLATSATTKITVTEEETPTVESIAISPNPVNLSLEEGATNNSATVTATLLPVGATGNVTWSISPEDVASITPGANNTATVTALSEGEATITATIGEVTATATVVVTTEEVPSVESITITPNPVNLSSSKDATNKSATVTATLLPEGSVGDVTWSISPETVATITPGQNNTATVTAVADGRATITATLGDISATAVVNVTSTPVVANNVEILSDDPDYFTVRVTTQAANPSEQVQRVAIFAWSEEGQTDINAKVATQISPGVFQQQFPVNGNEVHSYFEDAGNIYINVYASTVAGQNGDMIYANTYNYVNPGNWSENVAATSYVQNIGFNLPTVGQNAVCGTTGRVLGLEGIRLDTPIEGVELVYNVHVENIGWMNQVTSGTYAGTMHNDLQIEAIHVSLTGPNASNYSVQYQAHVQNIGWQNWVQNGAEAGTTGHNLQMEALAIQIVPAGTPLPANTR